MLGLITGLLIMALLNESVMSMPGSVPTDTEAYATNAVAMPSMDLKTRAATTAQETATPCVTGQGVTRQDVPPEYPEIDLPHPVFGDYQNPHGSFDEWNKKLAQELTDYHWQASMELTIRTALMTDEKMKKMTLKELDCRQSACKLVTAFTNNDPKKPEAIIEALEAVNQQAWAGPRAGSTSTCLSGTDCQATFYFSRDPVNDPAMEVIPWRRRK